MLAILILIPLGFLLTLITLFAMRKVRSRRSRWEIPGGGQRGGTAGPREPRRPLVPVGSASSALPEPRENRPPLDARGKMIPREQPKPKSKAG